MYTPKLKHNDLKYAKVKNTILNSVRNVGLLRFVRTIGYFGPYKTKYPIQAKHLLQLITILILIEYQRVSDTLQYVLDIVGYLLGTSKSE
jgi:hypothetical protein